MGGAGLDGGQGIGYRDIGIVVSMDADDAVEALADFGDHFASAAVRVPPLVSQRQRTSAPAFFAASSVRRAKSGIGDIAVEEMLGVVDDFLAVRLEVARRFRR